MNFEGKDYYNKLGVTKTASIEQIRDAYYREKFDNLYVSIWEKSDLDEAYYVLTDLDKKRQYDQYLDSKLKDYEYTGDTDLIPVKAKDQNLDNTIEITKENYKIGEDESENQNSEEDSISPIENKKQEQQKDLKDEQEPVKIFPIKVDKLKNGKTLNEGKSLNENVKKKIEIFGAIGSGLVGFAVVGLLTPSILVTLAGGVAIGLLANKTIKYKLNKTKKENKITKIETPETKLIEEYNKKFDDQIYRLLSEPHNNYNLEIARLRYENQIELLNQRIQMKKDENIKKGSITKHKLELTALYMQLETAQKRLSNINEKIENYSKEQSLSKLNKKISDKAKEIDAKESSQTLGIKKLKMQKSKLLEKRDSKANKLKLRRDKIGRIQDGVIQAYDMVRNLKNVFIPVEEIDDQFNKKVQK